MNPGRLARTLSRLHPLQIGMRAPHAIAARALRDVPGGLAPRRRSSWPGAPDELRRLADAERDRAAGRLARLPAASALRAYEACYGLELGADPRAPHGDWTSPTAVEAFPASVRARRIAVAARCGREGLESELARAARAIALHLELHLLGNHLLENGFGLACAGACAEGLEADLWWSAGTRILAWQLPQQFLADGGHVERSASYHAALTAALLEAIEIADASGRGAPATWRDTASRAIGWLCAVRTPDGAYPLFNDAALDAAPAVDDVLRFARTLRIAPRVAGRRAAAGDERLTHLESTGWVRLDTAGASAVVDAGPDAGGWQPGHAHADGLTFELWVGGARAIVDFGVATYEAGDARDATRATRSHNTAELEGRNSCEVWGAFRVGRRGRGRVVDAGAGDGAARVELEHDGYSWLPGAPHHVRSMNLRRGSLAVIDGIPGTERPWVSRLRVDAAVAGQLRVSADDGSVSRKDGVWYPRQGDARPAAVYEQAAAAGGGRRVRWTVTW
ncbi:MAG TPA: alginate lyase family protein [Polyangiaceae bacterium]|nr:alginate lyase family protein [Polyangiaceae bacterium]